jgi:transcription termination factor Rho
MRPRRRRPRGPRPEVPGAAPEAQSGEANVHEYQESDMGGDEGAAEPQQQDSGGAPQGTPQGAPGGEGGDDFRQGRRRRRRRGRGGQRPTGPGQPQGQQGGGYPQQNMNGQRDQNRGRRRRQRDGRGGGGGGQPQRRRGGLEILKDLQQRGAALDPYQRLILELPAGEGNPPYGDRITGRAIDLIAPIGRGQRCLLVAPPKAGKTRILQAIAASIAHNHPDVKVYALLVDERPEEVTDFKRNTPAEVIAASSDMSVDEHIETAERAMETVAQQVIEGKDVLLLLDSITRLARAYNAAAGNSGRTMSGGLDSNAMQAPRSIFGAARKIEDGGSLTIVGTALVDTGSRMDQIIFEEFKGTGNSEIFLSRELADRRIYPAIDIPKSGTRKEEKLIAPDNLSTFQALRRILVQMPPQEAMLKLTDRLNKTKTNTDFFNLVRVGES